MRVVDLALIFGLPIALILVLWRLSGFAIWSTLLASVFGLCVGLLLFGWHTNWEAQRIVSGKQSGAVLAFMPVPRATVATRIGGVLVLLGVAMAITLAAIGVRWVYLRVLSARR